MCVCVCVCFMRTAKNTHLCMDLQSGCTPVGTHPGLFRKRSMLSMGTANMFLDTPLLWRITEEQQLHIYEHACQFQCSWDGDSKDKRMRAFSPGDMYTRQHDNGPLFETMRDKDSSISIYLSHLQLGSSILLKLQAPF